MKHTFPLFVKQATIVAMTLVSLSVASCSEDNANLFYNETGLLTINVLTDAPQGWLAPEERNYSLMLTSLQNQETGLWVTIEDFKQRGRYVAGSYEARVSTTLEAAGFDHAPAYEGAVVFDLEEEVENVVEVRAVPVGSRVTVERDPSCRGFNGGKFDFGASICGSPLVMFTPEETRAAYFDPGDAMYVVTVDEGTTLLVSANTETTPATTTNISLSYDAQSSRLTARWDGTEKSIDVSPAALNAPIPTVNIGGAKEEGIIEIEEGCFDDLPYFEISGNATALYLTVESDCFKYEDIPHLMELEPEPVITLDDLQSHLTYVPGRANITRLTMMATGPSGRMSKPATITLKLLPARVDVIEVEPACIGINRASLTVATNVPKESLEKNLFFLNDNNRESEVLEILSIEEIEENRYLIEISLPEGNENVSVAMGFYDKIVRTFTVTRFSPVYEIEIDAFATKALVRISGMDEELGDFITRHLVINLNGASATVSARDTKSRTLTIIGLTPAKDYTLTASLLPSASTPSVTMTFRTESDRALPNGDFEDTKRDFKWEHLPAGGLYSQTVAAIFNHQNEASYDVWVPTGWATVNDKTFCQTAKNKNTWYMQPSTESTLDTASGDFAVTLTSTSFDPDGEAIPNYLQPGPPYTPYSLNIPTLRYRAAGRLFLGSYSFNPQTMEETYNEGVSFTSRPTSLNGYYKLIPCESHPLDNGIISVELLDSHGERVAYGESRLGVSSGYRTFSIALDYPRFGVKAATLKLTIASSESKGSIEYESSTIYLTADPVSSTAHGNRLTVDALSFGY